MTSKITSHKKQQLNTNRKLLSPKADVLTKLDYDRSSARLQV